MKFYIGMLVRIKKKHNPYYLQFGSIVATDYDKSLFQVQFIVSIIKNNIKTQRKELVWFKYKDLIDSSTRWKYFNMDEMTKAMYAGTVIQIRKDLHKINGKRIVKFGFELNNYLQTFEHGFFRIKNTEIICDFDHYKDLDYKVDAA